MNIRKILCLFGHKWEYVGHYSNDMELVATAACWRCRSSRSESSHASGPGSRTGKRAREILGLPHGE